jgi:hypothetical protein
MNLNSLPRSDFGRIDVSFIQQDTLQYLQIQKHQNNFSCLKAKRPFKTAESLANVFLT